MLAAAEGWGGGEDERPFLPRAFSYARHTGAEAEFLLEDVGPGTRRLIGLQAGELVHVLGPLGTPFSAPSAEARPILVGGGVGIAPLAILQDQIERGGGQVTVLLGFRDRARVQGAELLRGARLASDDGCAGHRGFVTDLLVAELAATAPGGPGGARPKVYACGPAPMLEQVRAICEREQVPAELALESGMACGFGACFGCVVPSRDGGFLRVCVEGPAIDAARLAHVDIHAGAPS